MTFTHGQFRSVSTRKHLKYGQKSHLLPTARRYPSLPRRSRDHKKQLERRAGGKKANQSGKVLAPIPGVITEIKVKEGDSVAFGQELCVLEAMKMKNSIKAGHDGTIARIHITVGEQVQQGKVLLVFQEKAEKP